MSNRSEAFYNLNVTLNFLFPKTDKSFSIYIFNKNIQWAKTIKNFFGKILNIRCQIYKTQRIKTTCFTVPVNEPNSRLCPTQQKEPKKYLKKKRTYISFYYM